MRTLISAAACPGEAGHLSTLPSSFGVAREALGQVLSSSEMKLPRGVCSHVTREFRVTQASGRQREASGSFRGPGGSAAGANGPRVSGAGPEARSRRACRLERRRCGPRGRAGVGALAAARVGQGPGRTAAGAGRGGRGAPYARGAAGARRRRPSARGVLRARG